MGFIIYLIIQIKSDIYFVIIIFSYYNYNLNFSYIVIVKRVIRYLKKKINYNITYDIANKLIKYTNVNQIFN